MKPLSKHYKATLNLSGKEQVQYFRDHKVSTSEQLRIVAHRIRARRAATPFDIEEIPYP